MGTEILITNIYTVDIINAKELYDYIPQIVYLIKENFFKTGVDLLKKQKE